MRARQSEAHSGLSLMCTIEWGVAPLSKALRLQGRLTGTHDTLVHTPTVSVARLDSLFTAP